MGPKDEMVTGTDVPMKELSWIDRMYQKLENMCVEVDKNPSLLFQETSKYMESQMNVVGTNVRKLCAELIQDLLPPPVLSAEMVVKKPESAVLCNWDCVTSEKPKQKTTNKTWEITEGGNEQELEDVQAKGHTTATAALEEHRYRFTENVTEKDITGSQNRELEIERSRIGEVTEQWEGTGKETDTEGHMSRLRECKTQSKVIGKGPDMVMKRCMENCASYYEAQQPMKVAESGAEEGSATQLEVIGEKTDMLMKRCVEKHVFYTEAQQPVKDAQSGAEEAKCELRSNSKPMYNSVSSRDSGCSKEEHCMATSGFFLELEEEEQEQSAQWFVSEDHKKLYRIAKSLSSSSFNPFDGDPQSEGPAEDFDSDWELL